MYLGSRHKASSRLSWALAIPLQIRHDALGGRQHHIVDPHFDQGVAPRAGGVRPRETRGEASHQGKEGKWLEYMLN